MRKNADSFLKQRRLVTPRGTIDFHIQQWRKYTTSTCISSRDNYEVCVWLATGIMHFLDTASYGSSRYIVCYSRRIACSASVRIYVYTCCVFERPGGHVREYRIAITA